MGNLALYDEYRPFMDTGDLLSYEGEGVVPSLIRLWSRGISHSGMVLDLAEFRGEKYRKWTLEASSAGARMVYLSRALADYKGRVWWHPLRQEFEAARNAVGCFALEQVGVVKYDFGSLAKNAFGYVSADLRRLFCSEYVFLAWRTAGIVSGKKAPRPADLPKLGVTGEPVLIVENRTPKTEHPQPGA
jgi:hypothetical protein